MPTFVCNATLINPAMSMNTLSLVDAETSRLHDGKNPTNSIENDNEYQYDCQVL